MKTKLLNRVVVYVCFGLFISCVGDGYTGYEDNNIYGEITTEINGEMRSFNCYSFIYGNDLVISSSSNAILLFTFPNTLGTHSFKNAKASANYTPENCSECMPFEAVEGTITLTISTEDKVKGFFFFRGVNHEMDEVHFRKGTFDIGH